jgi:hypothetical protein
MPKPMYLSDVLRQDTPRKNLNSNRYAALARDASPATNQGRPRANSVKRKNQDEHSFAEIVAAKKICPEPTNDGLVTELETEIAKVNSVCDKVAEDIGKSEVDPVMVTIFNGILEAVRGIGKVQTKIVENMDKKQNGEFIVVGASQKRPAAVTAASQEVQREPRELPPRPQRLPVSKPMMQTSQCITVVHEPEPVPETGEEKKLREFREAIFDAEKSTLIFNLDMGRIPVMNKETMSKRATMALSAMAAKVENPERPNTVPSADSVEAVDDVLSMVDNMELYGNETKTYKHPSDKLSGAFCTVPVRYEFSTPAVKYRAEKVLRTVCGAQCTTPYPLGVRECIKQIVAVVKNRYPDNFVRVTVDTKNMVFKVARKPPKDAPNPKWQYHDEHVPIPAMALDLKLRKVPTNFKLDIPATPRKDQARRASTEMDTNTPPSPPVSDKDW